MCVMFSHKQTMFSQKEAVQYVCDLCALPCMYVTHALDSPATYHPHIVRLFFVRAYFEKMFSLCERISLLYKDCMHMGQVSRPDSSFT